MSVWLNERSVLAYPVCFNLPSFKEAWKIGLKKLSPIGGRIAIFFLVRKKPKFLKAEIGLI